MNDRVVSEADRPRSDGQPINVNDTPEQLEVEDEDTTVVFQQEIAGVY